MYTDLLFKHDCHSLHISVRVLIDVEFVPYFLVKTVKSLPVWEQPYTHTVQWAVVKLLSFFALVQ